MNMIVFYESICRNLNINAKILMDIIVEKIRIGQYCVLYNNMNVYEYICNQKIQN